MRNRSFVAAALLAFAATTGILGCDSAKGSGSPTVAATPNVDQAKQFLATLKSQPPDKRQAYVAQHQDQVRNLNQSADPSLMPEFTQLMRETMKK